MAAEIDALKREIEALKEEKFSLLKIISHDIRSPFNRIFALLQLFEMESADVSAEQRQYINSMSLSLLSGLEMIQNLKDLREIDFKDIEIHVEKISFNDILKNVLRTLSQRIQLKDQSVTFEENKEYHMRGDTFLTCRALENLVSNALKFSKPNKEVKILCQSVGDKVEVVVKDCGEGIKPNEEPLLFERFSKLSSVASGGEGSLGLGLHNARHYARLMDGDVYFRRPKEMGSEFILQLPAY